MCSVGVWVKVEAGAGAEAGAEASALVRPLEGARLRMPPPSSPNPLAHPCPRPVGKTPSMAWVREY